MAKDPEEKAGTVAVVFASPAARYSHFAIDLEALKLPEGSVKDFAIGDDADELREELVARALKRKSDWVWFMDEDHGFEPEIVEDLLRLQKDIVAPVALSFEAPFYPEVYKGVSRASRPIPLALDDVIGPGGLVEISAAGPPGLLVRLVFELVEKPWFEGGTIRFCERASAAGVQAYVNTGCRISNRLHATSFPVHRAGKWELGVSIGGETELFLPLKH